MIFFPLRSSVKLFSGLSSFIFTAGISSPTLIWAAARIPAAAECAARVALVRMEVIAKGQVESWERASDLIAFSWL